MTFSQPTDLTKLLSEIQNPEKSHVDMIKRRAKGSLQWFLEKDSKTHPIHDNNHLEFHICGQDAFAAIEKDIRAAVSSIDLVLWGFDPGMELVRKGNVWPRGTTYGDLLTTKAREGVKIRLLVFYAHTPFVGWVPGYNIASNLVNNVPDIGSLSGIPWPAMPTELSAPDTVGKSASEVMELRQEYCRSWWRIALRGGFTNLEIRLRKAYPDAIGKNVGKYLPGSVRTLTEAAGMMEIGTHHQKPILIDYAPDKATAAKANSCGYVMGLNSVTDYWDTNEHRFNDPLREYSPEGAFWTKPWRLKPYRDYAIRVQGEALYSLNKNFVEGWDNASGYGMANGASIFSSSLEKQRKSVHPKDLPAARGARCRAQVLRTFPEKEDATILKAYVLATSNAVNYIYVENQYFQLDDWPRMIKKLREQYCQAMMQAGAKPADIAPLNMFVVIPQPERAEMVPNTYDTINQLGQGRSIGAYDTLVQGRRKGDPKNSGGLIVKDSLKTAPANPRAELEALGIKTVVAMLMTYDAGKEAENILIKKRDNDAQQAEAKAKAKVEAEAEAKTKAKNNTKVEVHTEKDDDLDPRNYSEYNIRPRSYREIYIHSKLMFVDDVYTTLGSANLNARSMAGDSELNICTEEWTFTKAARRRVWGNLAGDDLDGGDGTRRDIETTLKNWLRRMDANKKNKLTGDAPQNNSFIHPFEDPRGEPLVRLA
jgi:phosphatidylserine/phosphatidylglycerophosphate/cardiolipin synthase-like enzyme